LGVNSYPLIISTKIQATYIYLIIASCPGWHSVGIWKGKTANTFAPYALAYSFGMQAQKKVFKNASSKKCNCRAPFILVTKCFFYCRFCSFLKFCACMAIDALLQLHSLLLFFEQTSPK
jgi:hypothetical protein